MIDYSVFNDQQLIGMLRTSDRRAYTEIYNRYHYLLIKHVYKKLRDEDMAKDVIQELFTNLWLRREEEIDASNLVGYFYTIVRNRILDIFAHERVRSGYAEASLQEFASEGYNYDDTDHRVRERLFRAYIEQEIQALPKKMREVFELSRKGHLSHKEIAEQLGTSEHNVTKQVSNAIKILKNKTDFFIIIFFINRLL